MKLIHKFYLLIFVFVFCFDNNIMAQEDFNLAQYHNTYLLSNPAFMASKKDIEVLFHYRNQPNSSGESFRTAMLEGVYPLMNRYTGQRWGGIGVGLINDRPGQFISNNGLLIGYAHNFKIGQPANKYKSQHYISAGVQVGFFQRSINLDGLSTDAQFINGRFDPTASSNEIPSSNTKGYNVVSPGLMWYLEDTLGRQKGFLGVSMFNMNQPNTSFYNNAQDILPYHITTVGGYRVYEKNKISIFPTFRWINRSGSNEVTTGVFGKYKISGLNDKKFVQEGSVNLGLWYNYNKAFVVCLEWQQPKYLVAFNFDLPTSTSSAKWQGNSVFEITVSYRIQRKSKRQEFPDLDPIPTEDNVFKHSVAGGLNIGAFRVPVGDPVYKEDKPKTKRRSEDGAFRFKSGSSELDEDSKILLDSVAAVMMEYPDSKIDVDGHTDDVGDFNSNMELSKQRCLALKAYILQKYPEITADRILTEWHGPTKPIVPNTSEDNRRLNRRVSFKMFYPGEEVEDE